MKYSQYNTIIQANSHLKAVYNALWDRLVLINNDIDLINIDTLPSHISQKLAESRMLIEDNVDESEYVENLRSQAIQDSANSFMLIINPTLRCNFNCWYCYESHITSSDMTEEVYERTCRCIDMLTQRKKKLSISFFGGEPLLCYENIVAPIMKYATEKGKNNDCETDFNFTTNGYLITDSMIADFRNYNVTNFQITLDGGRETHDCTRTPRNAVSYHKIITAIKKLTDNGFSVTLRLNLNGSTINGAFSISDDFKNHQSKQLIKVSIHQIWQDRDKGEDIRAQQYNLYEHFAKNGFDIEISKTHQLKNPCYADRKNSYIINSDGRLFKCTAVDFANTEATGCLDSSGCLTSNDSSIDKVHNLRKNSPHCAQCRIMPLCNGGCYKNVWFRNNRSGIKCLHPSDKEKDIEVAKIVEDLLFLEMLSKKYNTTF